MVHGDGGMDIEHPAVTCEGFEEKNVHVGLNMSKSSCDLYDVFVGFGASMIGNQEATRFHSPTSLLDVDGFLFGFVEGVFVGLTLFFGMAKNHHMGKFIVFVSNHRRCTSNSLCFPSGRL